MLLYHKHYNSAELLHSIFHDREKAIAESLRIAREKFKGRLQHEIHEVKKLCEKVAQEGLRKTERLHKEEVTRLRERFEIPCS